MRTEETHGADKSDNPVVANVCCFLQPALPIGIGLIALKSGHSTVFFKVFFIFLKI